MTAIRTELDITVNVADVNITGGALAIPAVLEFDSRGGRGGRGGGGGSRGGGGGGGSRGGSGGGGSDDMHNQIGAAAGVAGIFGQFGLRRQLFSLQGLLKTVQQGVGPTAEAVEAMTAAATGPLAAAQAETAVAVNQLNAAIAAQAIAAERDAMALGQDAGAAAALAEAEAAVSASVTAAAGALQAEAAVAAETAAAEAGVTAATVSLTEAFWALLAPLLPIIAAVAALLAVIWAAVKAWQTLMQVLDKAQELLVASLRKLGEVTVWLGQQMLHFGEAVLVKTKEALQEFTQIVVDLGERGIQRLQQFVGDATGYFTEFEQAVTSTVAVMGIFGDEAEAVRQRVGNMANEMSRTSRFSGLELAQSMQEVAKAGYETEAALAHVTNAGRVLAEATLEDVTPATELLIKTLNQYELGAEQSMRVTNLLAAAANKSLASVESLGKALEYAGPSAHQFGMSIEETTAALMGMFQMGSRGSMAGTQLTNIFNGLIKQTKKAKDEFAKYGFDLAKISPTRMGIIQITQTLEGLQSRIGKTNMLELLGKSFELRALRGFNMLLTVGSARLLEMQRSITGTTDALQMQAEQMNTIQGAWKMLTNLWHTMEVAVMEGGLGAGVQNFLNGLRGIVAFAGNAGIFTMFGQVLGSLVAVAQSAAMALAGPLVEAVRTVLGMLPDVVAKVAGAVSDALPRVVEFIGKLPGIFQRAFDKIVPAVLKFATTVVPLLIDFATMALPLMVDIFSEFVTVVTQFLQANGGSLVEWFRLVLEAVLGVVQSLPQLVPAMTALVGTFIQLAPWLLQTAVDLIPQLVKGINELVPVVQQLATMGVSVLVNAMVELANLFANNKEVLYAYAALLMMVGQWVIQNWGAVSTLLVMGLQFATVYVNMLNDGIRALLGKVGEFANKLRTDWRPILATIFNVLADIGDLLVTKWQFALDMIAAKFTVFAYLKNALWPVAVVLRVILGLVEAIGMVLARNWKGAGDAMARMGKDLLWIMNPAVQAAALKAAGAAVNAGGAMRDAWNPMKTRLRDTAQELNGPGTQNTSGTVGPQANAGGAGAKYAFVMDLRDDLKVAMVGTVRDMQQGTMQVQRIQGNPGYGTVYA